MHDIQRDLRRRIPFLAASRGTGLALLRRLDRVTPKALACLVRSRLGRAPTPSSSEPYGSFTWSCPTSGSE